MKAATSVEHVDVCREPGVYFGWPANYGMWCWGDEIVLVFTRGSFENTPISHKRDRRKPFVTVQARSFDGGRIWTLEPFDGRTPKNKGISADEHMIPDLRIGNPYEAENPPAPQPTATHFDDPEVSVMVGRTTCQKSPGKVHSWFHVSRNRCRTWEGPFTFAGLDATLELAGRTDVVTVDSRSALFLLTAHKANGEEGRVFCARTDDGGQSFTFLSWLNEDPTGFEIMPSSVLLPNGRILTAVRSQTPGGVGSIVLSTSDDYGASWQALPPAVRRLGERGSNPPSMLKLATGRIVLVYGYRNPPYGIHARISDDQGRSWSDSFSIRDDGGDGDLGYPRAVIRSDGKVVIGYYYNTSTDGDRFIAASVWDAESERI